MMTMAKQWLLLFRLCLRLDYARPANFLSPILFAATLQLVFYFVASDLQRLNPIVFSLSQTLLAIFFAVQLRFLDLFKAELADDAFTILRSRLPHPEVWFLAKLASTACSCILVAIASLWMTSLMSAQDSSPILRWDIVVILAMVILGLTSLGTLLAALTDGIEHRVLLFPLIYFPLTTPILLAAGQCSLALAQNQSTLENLLSSWLGLLLIFDAIYVILSTLLFGELLKPES